jgi:hypothetical protein
MVLMAAVAVNDVPLAGGACIVTAGMMERRTPITQTIDYLLGCPSIA